MQVGTGADEEEDDEQKRLEVEERRHVGRLNAVTGAKEPTLRSNEVVVLNLQYNK